MHRQWFGVVSGLVAGASLMLSHPAIAATHTLDDRAAPAAGVTGALQMGGNRAPDGRVLSVDSRQLTLAGRPVLPVMGELHFSRLPPAQWERALRQMKAAGVTVVASYLIWRLHAPTPQALDWQQAQDLRRFVQLAHRVGLMVFIRPGPWVHAELRYGGLPDWLVDALPTRRDDPAYLREVQRWYAAIAQQLRGLLWKDGGPVIGLQIENEYNRAGPGQGAQHIATLKRLAQAAGLDVPLYTVTGWDHALFPRGEVLPVFGSYVDEPWSTAAGVLPPKTSYLFQFGLRNEQGLGAQGATAQRGDGERDADITPFLGAEYGAGVPQMYRRRPLIAPEDVSAMALTKLGSGVNLLGWYMFHGGRNPMGPLTHAEQLASGGWNDVPRINYDFQAPLSADGDERPVLRALRPLHLFLAAFGERLAPMEVAAPQQRSAGPADLATLRWAWRGDGTAGFVFVNNHVRQHATPAHDDTQLVLRLRDETLSLPPAGEAGFTVAPGEHFIWPVNLDLGGVPLHWASAQPVTRLAAAAGERDGDLTVFMATGATAPSFRFRPGTLQAVDGQPVVSAPAPAGPGRDGAGDHDLRPPAGRIVTLTAADGRRARLAWLPASQARGLSQLRVQGRDRLVWSEAAAMVAADGALVLHSERAEAVVGLWPQLAARPRGAGPMPDPAAAPQVPAMFTPYRLRTAALADVDLPASLLRAAGRAPAPRRIGPRQTPAEPAAEAFEASAAWQFSLPREALLALRRHRGLADWQLEIGLEADVARLFDGLQLLDDSYWIGEPWRLGLRRLLQAAPGALARPLTLQLMPLREDSGIAFDGRVRPTFEQGQVARLLHLRLRPVYRLRLPNTTP